MRTETTGVVGLDSGSSGSRAPDVTERGTGLATQSEMRNVAQMKMVMRVTLGIILQMLAWRILTELFVENKEDEEDGVV